MTIGEPGTGYPVRNTRMAGLVALDSEVIGSLLHLGLSLNTFMVVQFITFMVGGFNS